MAASTAAFVFIDLFFELLMSLSEIEIKNWFARSKVNMFNKWFIMK